MFVQTFLHFDGCCEEAVNFYCRILGGTVGDMMRFSQMPSAGHVGSGDPARPMPPGNHIMYASFKIGDTLVMASDGCEKGMKPDGFSLSITESDEQKVEQIFAELSKGGMVRMPLTETFFSPKSGQLIDRFGVNWMVLMPSSASTK